MIAFVTASISTAAFLALWFWVVHQELRFRKDIVKGAESQLAACRKNTCRPGTIPRGRTQSVFWHAAVTFTVSR